MTTLRDLTIEDIEFISLVRVFLARRRKNLLAVLHMIVVRLRAQDGEPALDGWAAGIAPARATDAGRLPISPSPPPESAYERAAEESGRASGRCLDCRLQIAAICLETLGMDATRLLRWLGILTFMAVVLLVVVLG